MLDLGAVDQRVFKVDRKRKGQGMIPALAPHSRGG